MFSPSFCLGTILCRADFACVKEAEHDLPSLSTGYPKRLLFLLIQRLTLHKQHGY